MRRTATQPGGPAVGPGVRLAEPDPDCLELLPNPLAAAQARAWLKSRLSDWSADRVEVVQLLVSELVTNAVLHTDGSVEVTVARSSSGITVEVADRNPSKPVVKTYSRDAATGRGLHLVEALADAWGVRGDENRKAVWFRVVDGAPHRTAVSTAGDIAGGPPLYGWPALTGLPAAAPPGTAVGPEIEVCIHALPVALYLAAEEHHDALMREFALVLRGGDGAANARAPRRLMELITVLVQRFGVGNDQRRGQVEAARRSGHETVDVAMLFPSGAQDVVMSVADQLDEVDGFCERGQLLTPPSTPAVKQFRNWYSEEVVRQLDGHSPSSWPYRLDLPPWAPSAAQR